MPSNALYVDNDNNVKTTPMILDETDGLITDATWTFTAYEVLTNDVVGTANTSMTHAGGGIYIGVLSGDHLTAGTRIRVEAVCANYEVTLTAFFEVQVRGLSQ